jgi:hypothetical protein
VGYQRRGDTWHWVNLSLLQRLINRHGAEEDKPGDPTGATGVQPLGRDLHRAARDMPKIRDRKGP